MTVTLIRLRQVDSTQDFLGRHPELGFCAVLADCQLAGRGQRGNRWESAPGAGLWLSAALPSQPLGGGGSALANWSTRRAFKALTKDAKEKKIRSRARKDAISLLLQGT